MKAQASKVIVRKAPASKVAARKQIESIYRTDSNLDQALRLVSRKNGATKDDLEAISWSCGLIYRLRKNYVIETQGERGAISYFVTKQL